MDREACVLRFMGSQRVGHDWATEMNWTESPCGKFFSFEHFQGTHVFLILFCIYSFSIAFMYPSFFYFHSKILPGLSLCPSPSVYPVYPFFTCTTSVTICVQPAPTCISPVQIWLPKLTLTQRNPSYPHATWTIPRNVCSWRKCIKQGYISFLGCRELIFYCFNKINRNNM